MLLINICCNSISRANLKSGGAAVDDELDGSLRGSQEAAFLVGDVEAEVSATDHEPASVELLVHVLFDLLGDLLVVGTIVDCVADDVLGLELGFRLQLGVEHFDAPLVAFLVHSQFSN